MDSEFALLYITVDRFFMLLLLLMAAMGWMSFFGHVVYTWASRQHSYQAPLTVTTGPGSSVSNSYERRPRLHVRPVTFSIDPFDQEDIPTIVDPDNAERIRRTIPVPPDRIETTRTAELPRSRSAMASMTWDPMANTRLQTPKPLRIEEGRLVETAGGVTWTDAKLPRPSWYKEK